MKTSAYLIGIIVIGLFIVIGCDDANSPGDESAEVAYIIASPTDIDLIVGSTSQVTAFAFDSDSNLVANVTFDWSTNNSGIASVSNSGVVTGIGQGTTQIFSKASSISSNSVNVSVTPQHGSLFSILLSPLGIIMEKDSSTQIQAVGQDANGILIPNVSFTWHSTDEDIATVSSNGVVFGFGEGASFITAKSGNVTSEPVGVLVNWQIEAKLSGNWIAIDFTSAPDVSDWFETDLNSYESCTGDPICFDWCLGVEYFVSWDGLSLKISNDLTFSLHDSISYSRNEYWTCAANNSRGDDTTYGGVGRLQTGSITIDEFGVPFPTIDFYDDNQQLIYYGIFETLSTDYSSVKFSMNKDARPVDFTYYWELKKE